MWFDRLVVSLLLTVVFNQLVDRDGGPIASVTVLVFYVLDVFALVMWLMRG